MVVLLTCMAASASADAGDAWQKANEAYAAGQFREATQLYEEVARNGATSASLFYNLGNAAFRSDDPGRAILNYERALALEPYHPEAQANLRLVRDKARALELRKSRPERAAAWATATLYTVAAAFCFWVAAFAFAAWLLAPRRTARFAACSVLALLATAVAVAGVCLIETGTAGRNLAVITGKNIEAKLATAENAGSVLALPPGSEIKILSTRGEWLYAALPNGLRGWIPALAAERVRP